MGDLPIKYKLKEDINHENYDLMKEYVELISEFGGYIAGGCFKDELVGNKAKDIDMYFMTLEGLEEAHKMVKGNEERFEFIFSNENVYSYGDKKHKRVIELNMRDIGKPLGVLQVFDFTVVKAALYKEEGEFKFLHHTDFFMHNKEKILEIEDDKHLNPLRTFNRLIRYVSYGYMPTVDMKESIVRSINGVTLANARIYSDEDGEDYLWYMIDGGKNKNNGYPMLIEVTYTQRYIDKELRDSFERTVNSPEDIRDIERSLYSDPLVRSVTWTVKEQM